MFDLANFMWHLVWHLLWNCFFWGALSLYSVLFKSTLKNANMQRNWLHGFRSLNCRGWIKGALGARCLGVCNHVGELPKHIPRLFPQKGILLQSQLQTRMTVTNIRSIILWKLWNRKRISLWSNESIPRPGSLFQQKVIARFSLRRMIKKGRERGNEKAKQMKQKGKNEIDGIQNWNQNQFWFTSEFNCA